MTTTQAQQPASGTTPAVPGPREALDEGTIHDLWLDAAEVHVDVTEASTNRPEPVTVVVPDDASTLIGSWDGYGV